MFIHFHQNLVSLKVSKESNNKYLFSDNFPVDNPGPIIIVLSSGCHDHVTLLTWRDSSSITAPSLVICDDTVNTITSSKDNNSSATTNHRDSTFFFQELHLVPSMTSLIRATMQVISNENTYRCLVLHDFTTGKIL